MLWTTVQAIGIFLLFVIAFGPVPETKKKWHK
jgi:hypothetical protein